MRRSFPRFIGEPNQLTVLQDIIVGLLAFEAFEIAFVICFSL